MFINSGMFYFKHCVFVTDRICKETLRSWFNLWLIPILVVHFGSSFTLTFEFLWSPESWEKMGGPICDTDLSSMQPTLFLASLKVNSFFACSDKLESLIDWDFVTSIHLLFSSLHLLLLHIILLFSSMKPKQMVLARLTFKPNAAWWSYSDVCWVR